ncbi:MAG: sigma-70 family RNA polymerase sigma factor [Acidobacteriia bacterium]|nr:sigma-70 family RNA polymerase sigma factor [Terriglobia bacterium]
MKGTLGDAGAAGGEARRTMISDETLMLEFQGGSREAFEELFARYRQPLFGFFRRRLENNGRAEELAQDTFLAVIRATSRYEARALVRTYLYSIALNLLAAERRKQARTPVPAPAQAEPMTNNHPDDALWVRQALEKLDADEREIVMLREYEQLSYLEISTLLRIPVNTVRSRLFRARMALKKCLEPERRIQVPLVVRRERGNTGIRPADDEA